ncbi:unnamed protein product [Pieris macdunnoughi]|uniref:Uncharacterized protein n=1 Tax=Pieris macdunnoughi TaxID=345717 RepID=A0A821NZ10_9NEOP|nr:unnamed protein product [Pieris macdunnoughi]
MVSVGAGAAVSQHTIAVSGAAPNLIAHNASCAGSKPTRQKSFSRLFGPKSINSCDGWTAGLAGQSKFKFAKSSHSAMKTGWVVNSVREIPLKVIPERDAGRGKDRMRLARLTGYSDYSLHGANHIHTRADILNGFLDYNPGPRGYKDPQSSLKTIGDI